MSLPLGHTIQKTFLPLVLIKQHLTLSPRVFVSRVIEPSFLAEVTLTKRPFLRQKRSFPSKGCMVVFLRAISFQPTLKIPLNTFLHVYIPAQSSGQYFSPTLACCHTDFLPIVSEILPAPRSLQTPDVQLATNIYFPVVLFGFIADNNTLWDLFVLTPGKAVLTCFFILPSHYIPLLYVFHTFLPVLLKPLSSSNL